jgi:excisionase family DNA binding protein
MTNEAWLTVEQVATHLNIASITVYRWIDAEKIPCHKVGRQWRFKASEIDEWVLCGEAGDDSNKKQMTKN